jgi:AP-3 complex subunit delta-1
LDLDAWINDPPSESEDESIPNNPRYDNTGLFSGNDNITSEYHKPKIYVEPTTEELEKQRESRKQSEQMNPFYLKDTKKTKSIHQV